jgi:hypothetical protein
MTSELISALEKDRSGLLLRVTAHMFRQQSDLLEQQAAVLERMATNPCSPSSWVVDEPSPESRQRQQVQESATALAVKSYESMLQVQETCRLSGTTSSAEWHQTYHPQAND